MKKQSKETNLFTQEQEKKIQEALNHIKNYTPKVGVFGDTGVGKSSLCNALFRKDIASVSDVEACTREIQEINLQPSEKGGLILVDVPGLGEDPDRHNEYIELYDSLVQELDLLLWVIKADDRKFSTGIDFYKSLNGVNIEVIFVINQVDKIEPVSEFYENGKKLSKTQIANIERKEQDVINRFSVERNRVIPVSATQKIGLEELVTVAIQLLPNDKKYSFSREAKKENVSKEAKEEVKRGILEYLGEALDATKDFVADVVEEVWDRVKPSWWLW